METQALVALAIAIPVVIFPAAFVWYLQIGGIAAAMTAARARKAARVTTTR